MRHRKEPCFYVSWEWTFRKFTSHALAAEPESATFQATGKILDDYFVLR